MEDIFDRPICDEADEDVAPESLRPTFEHARFSHKFAGEWQMQVPPTYAGAQVTDDWLRVQLGDFLAAFAWLRIESIEVATPEGTFTWQDGKGLSLSAWLDTLGSEVRRSYGYEAKLAACCYWADAEGRVGRSMLPSATDLDYDQTSRLLNLKGIACNYAHLCMGRECAQRRNGQQPNSTSANDQHVFAGLRKMA